MILQNQILQKHIIYTYVLPLASKVYKWLVATYDF
jgi:hypothetical protein